MLIFTMVVIIAWEITSDIVGVFNVPQWLDTLYRKVTETWHKVLF